MNKGERVFYVYEHWRPDRDACFYVGKGSGSRAYQMKSNRNARHKRTADKLSRLGMCVEVRLVADAMTESEAFELEIERIAYWKSVGHDLTNQTHGGDGMRPTEETRAKMRAAHIERWNRPGEREKTRNSTLAAYARGRKPSKPRGPQKPETIEKRSASMKGKRFPERSEMTKGDRNPFWGKTHTPETLARIAQKKRGSKLSEETKAKMRSAQAVRRAREALNKPPPPPKPARLPFKHTAATRSRMKEIAKVRGVSQATRDAQRLAVAGRKRAPFTESTIEKMRVAARVREAQKKLERA